VGSIFSREPNSQIFISIFSVFVISFIANFNINLQFDSPEWDGMTQDAKTLVSRMITVSPADRITAKAALELPWIAVSCM